MRRTAGWLIIVMLAALGPASFAAQESPTPLVLTLDEAVAMALRQNPLFLATQEQEQQAKFQVRSAVSSFLPTLDAQGLNTLDEKLFTL